MQIFAYLFGALIAFALGTLYARKGKGGGNIETYRGSTPPLDMRNFFSGNLIAFGTIEDISGKILARFTSAITADWQGDMLTLHENTTYDHGGNEQRTQTITLNADGHITFSAPDIAEGAHGKLRGNAARIRYLHKRTVQGRTMSFGMDEWWYAVDANHVVKKLRMTKLGFNVARITAGIYKQS